jgi:MATE family multidrug resistance protein
MRSAAMRNASVVATALYIGFDLALTSRVGPHGMWAALLIFYVARGVTLAVAYPGIERAMRRPAL